MKRPFALIGITYLSVQAALFYLESDLAAAILTAVCFIGTIVSLFILKNRNLRHTVLCFCLTAAFASTIFSGYNIFGLYTKCWGKERAYKINLKNFQKK